MAVLTRKRLVFSSEGKTGFPVIKLYLFPLEFSMTIGTRGSEFSFMNILFFMTSHTGGRGFSIFDSRQVTVLALNRLLHMSIIEGEIRFGMVKGGRVQWGNIGFVSAPSELVT